MSVQITQTCNGCNKNRTIQLEGYDNETTLKKRCENNGWREVKNDKHLCAQCINDLVG